MGMARAVGDEVREDAREVPRVGARGDDGLGRDDLRRQGLPSERRRDVTRDPHHVAAPWGVRHLPRLELRQIEELLGEIGERTRVRGDPRERLRVVARARARPEELRLAMHHRERRAEIVAQVREETAPQLVAADATSVRYAKPTTVIVTMKSATSPRSPSVPSASTVTEQTTILHSQIQRPSAAAHSGTRTIAACLVAVNEA
jgi:hypothetical protein